MHDFYLTRNLPYSVLEVYSLDVLTRQAKARLMEIVAVNHESVQTLTAGRYLDLTTSYDEVKFLFLVKAADDLDGASRQLDLFMNSL